MWAASLAREKIKALNYKWINMTLYLSRGDPSLAPSHSAQMHIKKKKRRWTRYMSCCTVWKTLSFQTAAQYLQDVTHNTRPYAWFMAVKPLTRSEWQIVFSALSMKLLMMSSKAALLSFAISYFPFITPLLQTQHAEKWFSLFALWMSIILILQMCETNFFLYRFASQETSPLKSLCSKPLHVACSCLRR